MNIIGITHAGTNSRGILDAMLRGVERAGHKLLPFDLARWPDLTPARMRERPDLMREIGLAMSQEFLAMARDHSPRLSIGMWGAGVFSAPRLKTAEGESVSIHELMGIPHLMYWIDAPWWAYDGALTREAALRARLVSPMHVHLTMSRSTGLELANQWRWPNVLPIEYAIDEVAFAPRRIAATHDLVMSNGGGDPDPTPHMLAALQSDDPDIDSIRTRRAEEARGAVLKWVDRFRASESVVEALVDALLLERLADPHRVTLAQISAAVQRAPHTAPAAQSLINDLALYRDVMTASRRIDDWRRAFDFTWLSRRCKSLLIGSSALKAWPHEADVASTTAYPDLAALYSLGRIGLNVMRWQDDTGLNIKPLELACCGVPVLQARRADAERTFVPGAEIALYDQPEEALAHVHTLLRDEHRRCAQRDAARARTLRDHTWSRRFGQILEAIGPAVDAARPMLDFSQLEALAGLGSPQNLGGSAAAPTASGARSLSHG